jgi:hypothetical protein
VLKRDSGVESWRSGYLIRLSTLTPALSQTERAGVRCLVLSVDLKDRVDYGLGLQPDV